MEPGKIPIAGSYGLEVEQYLLPSYVMVPFPNRFGARYRFHNALF